MNITIEIDDEILRKARDASCIDDNAELVRRALLTFSMHQKVLTANASVKDAPRTLEDAYQYLASIGGSMPDAEVPRRRRAEDYP